MPGDLGRESTRESGGFGITVFHWQRDAAITRGKARIDRTVARDRGRNHWHQQYPMRVAKAERAHVKPRSSAMTP